MKERMGPTRTAATFFITANSAQILGGLYAMAQHGSIREPRDIFMVLAGGLYLYGNYNLARVKKAGVELVPQP
jgi:hypothetical protein